MASKREAWASSHVSRSPRRRLASSALGFAGSEDRCSHTTPVDNPRIADRLDAFAALLELADANPYTARAYRRAAETIRGAAVPVAELVRSGACARAAGIGPGIAARLGELVETGEIAELAELERELAPDLIGLGRYLGLSAKRTLEIARALDLHSADELREAAADGQLRARGVGAKTESRLLEGLAREGEPRPRRALLLHRAAELVGGVASALGGEPAGDVRRWRDSLRAAGGGLCGVGSARRARASRSRPRWWRWSSRATAAPWGSRSKACRSSSWSPSRRASGLRSCARPALPATSRRSSRCPRRWTRRACTARSASRGVHRSCARSRSGASRRCSSSWARSAATSTATTWSDGGNVEDMARAALERGYDYLAICDHTPAVGAVRGLSADDVRRQAGEIAAANELLAPFRVLRSIECDILPDGRLDLPDDVLAELDWVQASVHGGQRMPRPELTRRVEEALRNPYVRCLSHP